MFKPFRLLLIGISSLILSACNKKDQRNAGTTITGTWELAIEQAGMIPARSYPSGNGNLLKFNDFTYQLYTDGVLTGSGTYIIINDKTVEQEVCLVEPGDRFSNRIIYDNDTNARKLFIQISGDTLSFLSGCFALDAGLYRAYIKKAGVSE
jgi:hypothetical protein